MGISPPLRGHDVRFVVEGLKPPQGAFGSLIFVKTCCGGIVEGGDGSDSVDIYAFAGAFHPDQIIGFSDADFAMDKDDRKSQTGYVFLINNGTVSWTSQKQPSVALSTMEAEYMSLSDAIARSHLYSDLDISTASSPLLHSDSTSALSLTDESAPYQRSKHI